MLFKWPRRLHFCSINNWSFFTVSDVTFTYSCQKYSGISLLIKVHVVLSLSLSEVLLKFQTGFLRGVPDLCCKKSKECQEDRSEISQSIGCPCSSE